MWSALLLAAGMRSQDFRITERVNYVLLDGSVRDRHGAFVPGLRAANFEVFENGKRRTITYFAQNDNPAAVGLVIDNSGSMARKRPEVIAAGLAFAHTSNPQDEFFVVRFNDTVSEGLPGGIPFSRDPRLLRSALAMGRATGRTALYDAIAHSLAHLQGSRMRRRTLVVVSDGGDNASRLTLAELIRMLESSQATVFAVALYDPENQELNPRILRRLCKLTGGECFEPKSAAEVPDIFDRVAREIRERYSLGYTPAEAGSGGNIRTVKVKASDGSRKLTVRTRTSYLMRPATEAAQ